MTREIHDQRPMNAETGRRGWVRGVVYGGVVLGTIGVVYLATRSSGAPSAAPAAHDHGAATVANKEQPVTLSAEQSRRIGVTYAVATLGTLDKEVRTVGQITYDETLLRTISPKIDGFVERLRVNATGQPVSVGQPLLTIYSPMLVQAQEELLLARRLQGDVAGGSGDARRGASDLLESARRRLAYWDIPASEIAAIERSGQARRTLTLYSPAAGYVLEKNVVGGQKVMAGDPLYKVADLRTVWVEGEVFEQDLANVRIGQVVHADFQALPDEHRMGRIATVYPTVNPETRTARVRVVFANRDLRLKPGMYATLRIAGAERGSVLTIPRDAVLSTGERNIVFVRDGSGQLVPREVALGTANDQRVEILRGLAPGETVVASATFLIDAESNLGKALGGMGDMPGMELSTPPTPLPMQAPKGATAPAATDHAGHAQP
ncbi:MAG TPA: efflux RND transporter periplasmic adaptor subunit [Gemmatimonadaceae bacterium]|jgi:multidrug efflux pump subunit AcrA (membrane-fusion protein)|nr:efflux RND transporter periplasmic adaptor subunit [Gemmatimonadaceae bacterium]